MVLVGVGILMAIVALWAAWPMKRKAMGEVQEDGADPDGWKKGAGD